MATVFRPLVYVFFLLLHLGCFIFSSSYQKPNKKRKLSSPSHDQHSTSRLKTSTNKSISYSWTFLKRIFSSKPDPLTHIHHIPSPSSSTRSLHKPENNVNPGHPLLPEPDQILLPLRNDIYPCTLCGEVFQNPNHLEQHQSTKHAVSELVDGDSGKNIVRIIFSSGWPDRTRTPVIHRILKVHNSKKILTRFEEYREHVKLRASRNIVVKRDERCLADGNELLRFHCTTFMCELGQNGESSICNNPYCSVCGIVRSGFSKKMDGICVQPTSYRAHVAIPEEIEEEFGFMYVRRAMLVCRVIAGRVGCDPVLADKEDQGFDSLAGTGREDMSGVHVRFDEEDELLVFSPRAVLPCFVIVYTV